MDTKTIMKEALHLRPPERLKLIECLTNSLDCPDKEIEKIWEGEAEKRYRAYKKDKVKYYDLKEIAKRYR